MICSYFCPTFDFSPFFLTLCPFRSIVCPFVCQICLVLSVCLFCPVSSILCLDCSTLDRFVIFHSVCLVCPALHVLFYMSCFTCTVLHVLFYVTCFTCPVLHYCCTCVLSVFQVCTLWLILYPFLSVLSFFVRFFRFVHNGQFYVRFVLFVVRFILFFVRFFYVRFVLFDRFIRIVLFFVRVRFCFF